MDQIGPRSRFAGISILRRPLALDDSQPVVAQRNDPNAFPSRALDRADEIVAAEMLPLSARQRLEEGRHGRAAGASLKFDTCDVELVQHFSQGRQRFRIVRVVIEQEAAMSDPDGD